jgi:lipoprotein-anchoring transpeptidase ErfK/SrfK
MSLNLKGDKKINKKGGWFLLAVSIFLLLFSLSFFAYTKYPSLFESQISLEKNQEISPESPIIIHFSKPIIANHLGWKLDIYPRVDFDYHWENYNRKLVITPRNHWSVENEYEINISGENIFLSSVDKKYYFRTINYPKLTEFHPAYGEKDVVLDIEDPMTATFGSSLNDFNIKFTMSPFKEINYNVDAEKNEIQLMPKEDLDKGQRYTIGIYVKYKDEEESAYKKISETFFDTKAIPPQTWEKDFSLRLEQAKKFTEAKIKDGKYIDINLKSQVMTIFENGELMDAYMVSSGKRGMETPQGSFQVSNKTPRAWSKEYGLFMPYWMAMVRSGSFGIHELPEWPGGYKEGANHLGTPVSHGCIRLGVGPAKRVYDWADMGTPVIIHI